MGSIPISEFLVLISVKLKDEILKIKIQQSKFTFSV